MPKTQLELLKAERDQAVRDVQLCRETIERLLTIFEYEGMYKLTLYHGSDGSRYRDFKRLLAYTVLVELSKEPMYWTEGEREYVELSDDPHPYVSIPDCLKWFGRED